MPNIKSAKKRVEVIKTKTAQNRVKKTELKTFLKRAETAIAGGDTALAGSEYALAIKKIDKAVARGILHKNTAARRKSALALKINALSQQAI